LNAEEGDLAGLTPRGPNAGTTGTIYTKTLTKPLPAGARIIVRKGQRLDRADRLAAYLGLRLVPDPDATPPDPTPENLARPTLAKRRAKRNPRLWFPPAG
jgi:hypothetical protein